MGRMTRSIQVAWSFLALGLAATTPRSARAQRGGAAAIVALPEAPDALSNDAQALHHAVMAEAQSAHVFPSVRAGAVTASDAYMLVGCPRPTAACYKRLKRILGSERYVTLTLAAGSAGSGYRATLQIVNLNNGRVLSTHEVGVPTTGASAGDLAIVARRLLGEEAESPPAAVAVAPPPPVNPPARPTVASSEIRPPPPHEVEPHPAPPPERVTPPVRQAPSAEPPPARGRGGMGAAPVVLGIAGLALVGGGAVFALLRDQTQTQFTQTDNTTLEGIHRLQQLRDQWNRDQLLAWIGYGAGAALCLVSATLIVIGLARGGAAETDHSTAIDAALVPLPGGAALALGGRF